MSQTVTLKNSQLTVSISTLGAELQSIVDCNGIERIWQRDPKWWSACAPILFPVAGGYKDDAYYMDGVRYEMPKHGFVRKLEWAMEEADAEHATFLMKEKHPGFPFDYEMRVLYRLENNCLKVSYRVTNKDSKAFWYGLGAHEAYATPEGVEKYTLLFDEQETLANYELVGNLIKTEPEVLLENTDRLPLMEDYFKVDALVFRGLKSHGVTLQNNENGRKIRVDFPKHDVLMLWQKYGAPYICIEPWINAPDFLDTDQQIEHKPGCICLKPGCTEEREHTITVL